jgi:hypothetical protein
MKPNAPLLPWSPKGYLGNDNHDLHDWEVSSRPLAEGIPVPGRLAKIRRWGDGILLEPIKPSKWPNGYFEKVKIKDSAFERQP